MLFYPILYSFLPYFIPYSPTPQVEKTVKMPILPVLTIFVCVFPFSPSLLSSPSLCFVDVFFSLLLSFLSFSLPSLLHFAVPLSYSIDKKKRSNKNCLALLFLLFLIFFLATTVNNANSPNYQNVKYKDKNKIVPNQ